MIYGKMMSKYKERVASAETVGDFATIWLVIMLLHVVFGIVFVILEWFEARSFIEQFLFPEDYKEVWVNTLGDGFFHAFVCLLGLICLFQKTNVRFWDPRVYWLKEYYEKIDVEEIRKIHTGYLGTVLAGANIALLFVDVIFILVTIIMIMEFWG